MSDLFVVVAGRAARHPNPMRGEGPPRPAIDDARERAAGPRRGYSGRASWRDPHTLETMGIRDGQPIGGATYAVSPDGRTLTISADQQVIVLDRVSGA